MITGEATGDATGEGSGEGAGDGPVDAKEDLLSSAAASMNGISAFRHPDPDAPPDWVDDPAPAAPAPTPTPGAATTGRNALPR